MTDVAETLLPVLNEAIATILDKEALFKVVSNELRQIFPFDLLVISVFDAEMKNERLFLRAHADGNQYVSMPVVPLHFAAIGGSPLEDLLSAPGVGHTALVDSLARYPNAESLRQMWAVGIRYRTCVPLRRGGRLIGALTLATRCPAARSAADDALLEKIGALVAAAVANTLAFEDLARREQERTLQLTIGTALLSIKRREPLFRAIAGALSHVVPFQYFGIRVQRAGQPKVPEDCAEFRRGSGPDSALETVAIDHGQW
uniref:GAF domain-containing protein n=1 Tax=uncultured Hymenobacter sp. TaxID=170016 RepID=UPI0035CB86AF